MYLAELDPLNIHPKAELRGFRSASEVLVFINGRLAAERYRRSKSSTGAFLSADALELGLIQATGQGSTCEPPKPLALKPSG